MIPAAALHTHTWRCQHASGDAADYVQAALAEGCRTIGITDHTPQPDGRWDDVRMRLDQLDGYCAAVREAGRRHSQARVLLGMECEDGPDLRGWYRDELLGRCGCDYLVGSVHYLPDGEGDWSSAFANLDRPGRLRAYADACVALIASGLYAFLAHPDLFGLSFRTWTPDCAAAARDVCAAAAAHRVPLELNGNGLRKGARGGCPGYPWRPFWEEAAGQGVAVVVNADAHHPHEVVAGCAELEVLRLELGLPAAEFGFL